MKSPLTRRTVTYIVRVWTEYLHATPTVWRGEVALVEGEEVYYFRDLEEMTAWIRGSAESESEDRLED